MAESPSTSKPTFNRKNPLIAHLPRRRFLSEGAAEKQTWHLEIDLQDSGLSYTPGDSLAVLPTNESSIVDEIIAALGLTGDESVIAPDKSTDVLRTVLSKQCVITLVDKKFLAKLVEKAGDAAAEISALLAPEKKKELSDYLWGRETIDFLLMFPELKWEAQEFVSVLKKLNIRLYSISSSLAAVPNQVHLTIASVIYNSFGRERKGVCSTFLNERCDENTDIPCFVTPGKGFRLPAADDDTPIIMCGPGTGIAPFRAFLQERHATQAKGDAWLFFGEIHQETCYFYQEEWESYLADGTLNRITTAFSRDQDHKIYVHHRMLEEGAQLWSWLERGAIFYVCGDAERMANDVDQALHQIAIEHGGKSEQEAAEYIEQMRQDKRYRRDVY
ncbi:MAG: sulfite reductase subunit alpha [Verrucomicrobiales bacterium]|nr:sulfite reductase subunit alpha [Verrucomicrobiales bacterium]